ncbi:MAG: hypothetical protein FWB93_03135 [Oscillospiraceae bacterium]|nr:hypothetical protein [Oscillospiraceae bacterium]
MNGFNFNLYDWNERAFDITKLNDNFQKIEDFEFSQKHTLRITFDPSHAGAGYQILVNGDVYLRRLVPPSLAEDVVVSMGNTEYLIQVEEGPGITSKRWVNVGGLYGVHSVAMFPNRSLQQLSWQQISELSRTGEAKKLYQVGDVYSIEYFIVNWGQSFTQKFQIAGFDYDDLPNGEKAGITFVMYNAVFNNLFNSQPIQIHQQNTPAFEQYSDSLLATRTIPMVASAFGGLAEVARTVVKTTEIRRTFDVMLGGVRKDLLTFFPLSTDEIFGNPSPFPQARPVGMSSYPLFDDPSNRVRVSATPDETPVPWVTRTSLFGAYMQINEDGFQNAIDSDRPIDAGLIFGFCI